MLLDNIKAGIKQIEQMMGSAADGMNLEEKKLALVRAKIEKTAELTEDKEELERLKGIVERSTGATVQVWSMYIQMSRCVLTTQSSSPRRNSTRLSSRRRIRQS